MAQFFNHIGYSDTTPYEVIRRVGEKTYEVRAMKAERDESWKPEYVAGGFAGHCYNQSQQRWNISVDTQGEVVRVRLHKDGQWRDAYRRQFLPSETPRRYYDFNF